MKKIFCSYFALLCLASVYAQATFKPFLNSKVKFDVVRVPMKYNLDTKEAVPGQHMIIVRIDSVHKKLFLNAGKDKILDWLAKPDTDWATNLILYDIFKKDGIMLLGINREDWVLEGKEKDMQYWKRVLK